MPVKPSDRLIPGTPSDATEEQLRRQQFEYRRRASARLHLGADDLARMVSEFAASHGGIVMGPPAYAAASPQYGL